MNKEHHNFLFDDKQTKKIMRKARFWSTIKMIGITLIVTPIVLIAFWYGLRHLSLNSAQKVSDDIHLFNEISAPNVQISNQKYDDNLLGGKIITTTYKVLGDQHRPYIWTPIESDYNLFGTLTQTYISKSIQIEGSESLAETHQLERFNDYTGDREMFFYHPKISYDQYKDKISELKQLENNTLVELAISFDNAYSFDEIKSKLPTEVQVDWWWVDAYTDDTLDFFQQGQNTIPANYPYIYGFQSEQSKPKPRRSSSNEVDTFIRNIELLRESKNFEWETNEVYQALIGENGNLETSDVKIIGAVVTGTPEQLQLLQGKSYIKASTFGVISNQK
ncbi:anti sigma factor C-terminal domain-containing protein [Lysinibacillus irui]|uniref:Anti sigma factor C-terminal domain-containing protein n=1 Tax=Lysinibacillus irui TaxID=2998077 RepID=A0ABU5NH42_9BACI|nr:anti sigma factor C-terminal domain-containing protein [Lysinibacillus irui]MEA0552774.1 anti sigma factor C-terminal domain-containing protein [Lysinibacillus irui]MEA0975354.1 anti sigma factor C-terminal domain-containing protein [Lysinibacillus irui]MEA1041508.1 anti sigma factor C-terminal domain-containing protein [Lysinibacillus irui]